jgi:hypothetical protein
VPFNSLCSNGKLIKETSLAYIELYLTIASIFRLYKLELFETSVEDIKMAYNFFSPVPRLDSKGVCVRVIGEVKE